MVFIGVVDGKTVKIEGTDLKDAMNNAGYIPLTKVTSHNKFVGQLTDGRRYSITYQARKDKLGKYKNASK